MITPAEIINKMVPRNGAEQFAKIDFTSDIEAVSRIQDFLRNGGIFTPEAILEVVSLITHLHKETDQASDLLSRNSLADFKTRGSRGARAEFRPFHKAKSDGLQIQIDPKRGSKFDITYEEERGETSTRKTLEYHVTELDKDNPGVKRYTHITYQYAGKTDGTHGLDQTLSVYDGYIGPLYTSWGHVVENLVGVSIHHNGTVTTTFQKTGFDTNVEAHHYDQFGTLTR